MKFLLLIIGLLNGCVEPTINPGVPWIDAHSHCVLLEECDAAQVSLGGAVIASLEHFTININFDDVNQDVVEMYKIQNADVSTLAAAHSNLDWYASLPCWYEVQGSSAAWVDSCKADVDALLLAGAVGFKDHVGKQFDHIGEQDGARFLGAYNRFAGYCGDVDSNKECMEQMGVKYPILEASWREVVRYIVEEKQALLLTHTGSYMTAEEQCNENGEVVFCPALLVRAQADFAEWVASTLTKESANRIILAHFGYLQEDLEVLEMLLEAGVSMDTAQGGFLYDLGCSGRKFFVEYPDQWIFGTDLFFEEDCSNYNAWFHMFTGTADEEISFNTCRGEQRVKGMDLKETSACGIEAPSGVVEKLLAGNLKRLLAARTP